jgi:hypothetical protein
MNLASLFANLKISKNATTFLRVDHMFNPNPRGEGIDYIPFSDRAESTLIIAGVDFLVDNAVHIMPNIETVVYGESSAGSTPNADLIPRITLQYNF